MHQDRHFLKFQKGLDLIKYMNTQIRRSKVRRVEPTLLIFNIDHTEDPSSAKLS